MRVEQTYLQAARHHNTMETSGTVARWDGDRVTLWDAVQASSTVVPIVSTAFGIDAADVRVVSPHTGGGFGAKGYIWPHEILAAAAARVAGRPVKLHLRRADQFSSVGYQPWMEQTIRLAADADGVLLGVEHHAVNNTGLVETHVEPATEASKSLYASPSIRLRLEIERVSLNVPTPMRAPVEGPGLWALESAMNELADEVGVDPLDLRLANFAEVSPADGRPWSSNRLREAYAEGARRYGWRTRHDRPRQDGPWRIGHGMATCSMGSFRFPGAARVHLSADGGAVVESNVHDIGSGAQTVLSQIAAEELGIPLDRVTMRWGDTDLPRTGPTYGSSTTMGTGSAVAAAARDVTKQLADLGVDADRMAEAGVDELVGEGAYELPDGAGGCSTATARAPPTPCARGARSSSRWASIRTSACCGCGAQSASTPPGGSSTRSRRGRRWSARSSGAGARRPWRRVTRSRCTAGGSRRTSPTWPCRSTPTSLPTSTCRSSTSSTRPRA